MQCSSRGPRFSSQHLHGSSQLSVTPDSRDLMSSLASVGSRHTRAAQTYMHENTHTQKKEEKSHFSQVSDAHLRPRLF